MASGGHREAGPGGRCTRTPRAKPPAGPSVLLCFLHAQVHAEKPGDPGTGESAGQTADTWLPATTVGAGCSRATPPSREVTVRQNRKDVLLVS